MSLTLVTAPVGEVVTLQEIREHLRIDHAHDDVYLLGLIRAATEMVEGRVGGLNVALLTQTWDETRYTFPYSPLMTMFLSLSPVQSVTSITYVDTAGAPQTWAPADYVADLGQPAQIFPAHGKQYPAAKCQPGAVTVRYVAGYGTRVAVPQGIRQIVAILAAHFYENREPVTVGSGASAIPIPMHIEALMRTWRVVVPV